MSYYPRGVSDKDLPGYSCWEGTLERSCGLPARLKVLPSYVEVWAPRLFVTPMRDQATVDQAIERIRIEVDLAYEVEVDECPFTGQVDAYGTNVSVIWTCPLCKQLHEEVER